MGNGRIVQVVSDKEFFIERICLYLKKSLSSSAEPIIVLTETTTILANSKKRLRKPQQVEKPTLIITCLFISKTTHNINSLRG